MNSTLEEENLLNSLVHIAACTSQSTLPIDKIASYLGLPEKHLTETQLTVTVRFKPTTTAMMNAAMYDNPYVDSTQTNSDTNVLKAADNTVAITSQTSLVYDLSILSLLLLLLLDLLL